MLNGHQMKAINNYRRLQADAQFTAWENALRNDDPCIPFSRVEQIWQAERSRAANNAWFIIDYGDGLRNAYIPPHPQPEPKGPPDFWHWMAHLEETGQLRWWHHVQAMFVLFTTTPLDDPET